GRRRWARPHGAVLAGAVGQPETAQRIRGISSNWVINKGLL
ncbi:hypothetical protein HMPREF0058_1204, partial [Actinomyces urogenitalis DSM 15434]